MSATPDVNDYDYTPHPKGLMMPELTEEQYTALKAGIADHGLQHSIRILKGTRYLLDGRHRLRACKELRYPIKVEAVDIREEDVPIYTGAEAAKRPGLTVTQKVLHALKVLPSIQEQAAERQHLGVTVRYGEKGKAAGMAASLVGVSARSVEVGIALQRNQPELFKQMEEGELELFEAKRQAEGKERKSKLKEDRFLAWRVPDYLRKRLDGATAAVGGDVSGDGLEALLDFIEGEGKEAWETWAEARKNREVANESAA